MFTHMLRAQNRLLLDFINSLNLSFLMKDTLYSHSERSASLWGGNQSLTTGKKSKETTKVLSISKSRLYKSKYIISVLIFICFFFLFKVIIQFCHLLSCILKKFLHQDDSSYLKYDLKNIVLNKFSGPSNNVSLKKSFLYIYKEPFSFNKIPGFLLNSEDSS